MNRAPVGSGPWRAALLDLDGTLVDTSPGVRTALTAALEEVTGSGLTGARADMSLPLDEMIRTLNPAAPSAERRQVSEAFRKHYDQTHWTSAHPYAGAEELLRDLRAAGIRAFVVTNKRATAARRLLDHFRMARFLDGIVGQPDSGGPLPKSELTGQCLAAAGLEPSTTVIVGDSDQDAAAAAFWGITFVAVTSGAGPLGHASTAEQRVEVASLADATALLLRRPPGGRS